MVRTHRKNKEWKIKKCFAGRKNSKYKNTIKNTKLHFFTKMTIKNEKTKQNKKTRMYVWELKNTRSSWLTLHQAKAKEKIYPRTTYAHWAIHGYIIHSVLHSVKRFLASLPLIAQRPIVPNKLCCWLRGSRAHLSLWLYVHTVKLGFTSFLLQLSLDTSFVGLNLHLPKGLFPK